MRTVHMLPCHLNLQMLFLMYYQNCTNSCSNPEGEKASPPSSSKKLGNYYFQDPLQECEWRQIVNQQQELIINNEFSQLRGIFNCWGLHCIVKGIWDKTGVTGTSLRKLKADFNSDTAFYKTAPHFSAALIQDPFEAPISHSRKALHVDHFTEEINARMLETYMFLCWSGMVLSTNTSNQMLVKCSRNWSEMWWRLFSSLQQC